MISFTNESIFGWCRAFGAAALVPLCLAGCTPVSQPAGSLRAAGDAGPDASPRGRPDAGDPLGSGLPDGAVGERCEREGAMRCGSSPRQRQRCESGRWSPAEACGEDEVCAEVDGTAGQCASVAGVCRGAGSATVCDERGTMYRCSASGLVTSSESCASARHCQLGLSEQRCASCLPGEFRCKDDALEVCDGEGREFRLSERCAADTCDAEAGMCRGAVCPDTRAICEGDVLAVCPEGARKFEEVARCGPGLCNAAARRCDACVPGTRRCEGDTALTCSADGGELARRDCAADQVHCVGAGECVECGQDADCAAAGPCAIAYCDFARGVCSTQPRAVGSPCPDGMCTADGECVSCLADSDCPEPPPCGVRKCDPTTRRCAPQPAPAGTPCGASGVCDGAGSCAGCVSDSDCPGGGECQLRQCSASKTCELRSAPDGQDCTGNFGAGTCDDGRCVQCQDDGDCGGAAECEQAFCRSTDSSCQRRPAPAGAACSGGDVCDGTGGCVECTVGLHCGDHAQCVSNTCVCDDGYVPNPGGGGCNFDECKNFDDNRCGAWPDTGNTCVNTLDGYECRCGEGWRLGEDQCYQGGSDADVRTVPNGSSWNVLPDFGVVCQNAFNPDNPCTTGQLTWLHVCGLPEAKPEDCSAIGASSDSLAAVNLKRVAHSGPLQEYGQPSGPGTDRLLLPAVGDVILVQSLTALYVMRIRALDAASMTFEWATIWRDACWRPGGLSCTAACNCPGGN